MKLGQGFAGSLDHNQEGFSQKKVMGYAFLIMVAGIHLAWWKYQLRVGNFSNLAYVLGADLTFIAACLGINYLHEKNISNGPDDTSSSSDVTSTK
jgi:hypothetical protein